MRHRIPWPVWSLAAASALVLACCGGSGGSGGSAAAVLPPEAWTGGSTTVFDTTISAFKLPAPTLAGLRLAAFQEGRYLFDSSWLVAPGTPADFDGLGPLFNASSCVACHQGNGRSGLPAAGDPFVGLVLRIGDVDDPDYGGQIQNRAIPGFAAEGEPRAAYVEVPGTFADGTPYSLRAPSYTIESPAYGPLPPGLSMSPRIAPHLPGVGLLEAIPAARLLELADPADADGDGISGRTNLVFDAKAGLMKRGRFGWKAGQPHVEQAAAGALRADIGVTTPLFPTGNCAANQTACASAPDGGSPEVDQYRLDLLTLYVKLLGVPGRRRPADPQVLRGQALFAAAGCAKCHAPSHVTGTDVDFPELSNQTIYPYTDLLLHDLGPDLADGRPEADATGTEWRTPPLWGIGLIPAVNGHTLLLHDGRARSLTEAILWHGGEALPAREFFRNLSAAEREDLLAFLNDL